MILILNQKNQLRVFYLKIIKERLKLISNKNNKEIKPGNPNDFQKGKNPFLNYIDSWETDNNLDKTEIHLILTII